MTDRRTVKIRHLGHKGHGAAEIDGVLAYFPYTLPDEQIQVSKRSDGGWHIEGIVVESPSRQKPVCAHFGACGGCMLQHLKTADYLDWKRTALKETLAQRGFTDVPIDPIFEIPQRSRRRLVLTAEKRKGLLRLGLSRYRSRAVEDISECPVALPEIEALFPGLRAILDAGLGSAGTARVTVNQTDTGADVLVEAQRTAALDQRRASALAQTAAQTNVARLTWNDELIFQRDAPQISVGSAAVVPPAGAFLQASKQVQDFLIDRVSSALNDASAVIDLFCGIGTFSLPLTSVKSVLALDSHGDMIEALNVAAKSIGASDRLAAQRRDLLRRPLQAEEMKKFDAAVLDPPRAGASAQMEQLSRSGLSKIVYVSCNPATFARDARILVNAGFQMGTVQPIDQFLWSPHTELVAEFIR